MRDEEYEEGWRPYVPVAERRRRAQREAERRRRQGRPVDPIPPRPRQRDLAETPWGRAWCANAEAFSSWRNRLERGKRYLRNGSVFHLELQEGRVRALVSGNEIYEVCLEVSPLPQNAWARLVEEARGQVESVLDLLQGRIEAGVMTALTRPRTGMFPTPKQVRMHCSCPDFVTMCKHVAATFYGVGVRLDERPEVLFRLRGVDHGELVQEVSSVDALVRTDSANTLQADSSDLGTLFGIDLVGPQDPDSTSPGTLDTTTGAKPGPRPVPPRLPQRITPAMLLDWGVPRSTFQNWVGSVLEPSGERGVYLRTRKTRARLIATRRRLGLED